MNFSNFRINAYKNTGESESSEENKSFADPVFKKISGEAADKIGEDGSGRGHRTMDEIFDKRFFPQLSDKNFQGNESARVAAKALTSGGLIKVPAQAKESDGRESIYRRVAKFLTLIGVDEAAKILPHLSEEQTEKIIPEIASIRYVEPDEAREILQEFQGLVRQAREGGGLDTARAILEKAFGSHRAGVILEKTTSNISGRPFEYLSEADSDRVSLLLRDESNAVKALVLSYLEPRISAQVISGLGSEDKKDVAMRLARLTKISPEIVQRVDKSLQEKMNHLATSRTDSIDGKNVLAQILRRMSPEVEEGILSNLAEQDSELGADLRERLFTVEDIINADDRFIQDRLRDMDEEEVACLIAAKDEGFREKILGNLSENRRKSILETEEFLRPMRKSDCEKATARFFATLRRAHEEGRLYIRGRDDELYV